MSEPKWTDGPLIATRFGGIEGGPVHQFERGDARLQIGMALLTEDVAPEERDANASLWAAAPDLYEALEAVIAGKVVGPHPNAVHPSGMFCESCGRNSEDAVHYANCKILKAELALRKARGEAVTPDHHHGE